MIGQRQPGAVAQEVTMEQSDRRGSAVAIVVNLVVRGMKLSDIVAHMREYYEEPNFKQSHPYLYLRYAAERGMLSILAGQRPRSCHRAADPHDLPGIEHGGSRHTASSRPTSPTAPRRRSSNGLTTRPKQVRAVFGWVSWAAARSRRCAAPWRRRWPDSQKPRRPAGRPSRFRLWRWADNVREPLEDPASFFTYFADSSLNPLRRDYIAVHAPVFRAPHGASDGEDKEFERVARGSAIVRCRAGLRWSVRGRALVSRAPAGLGTGGLAAPARRELQGRPRSPAGVHWTGRCRSRCSRIRRARSSGSMT